MASKVRFAKRPAWSLCACLSALLPSGAFAQAAHAYAFSIQPNAAAEALIEFAVQANISIGGVNSCRGRSSGLRGRYTIDAGLAALLSRTGCGYRRVALDTIQIVPEAPAPSPSGPDHAPEHIAQPPALLAETSPLVVTSTKLDRPDRIAALRH